MIKKTFRIYVDTPVIGGCLDEEFSEASRALMGMARRREIVLLLSDLLLEELERAPDEVCEIVNGMPPDSILRVTASNESRALRDAYIAAGVVSDRSLNDAHHVALAALAGADVIASWNFKHIVHFDKIRMFNAVNLREGFPVLDIRSPREII